jgi:hypothetical protein
MHDILEQLRDEQAEYAQTQGDGYPLHRGLLLERRGGILAAQRDVERRADCGSGTLNESEVVQSHCSLESAGSLGFSGLFSLAVGYLLICRVGSSDLRKTQHVLFLGAGIVTMSPMLANTFGPLHGGSEPLARLERPPCSGAMGHSGSTPTQRDHAPLLARMILVSQNRGEREALREANEPLKPESLEPVITIVAPLASAWAIVLVCDTGADVIQRTSGLRRANCTVLAMPASETRPRAPVQRWLLSRRRSVGFFDWRSLIRSPE